MLSSFYIKMKKKRHHLNQFIQMISLLLSISNPFVSPHSFKFLDSQVIQRIPAVRRYKELNMYHKYSTNQVAAKMKLSLSSNTLLFISVVLFELLFVIHSLSVIHLIHNFQIVRMNGQILRTNGRLFHNI